MIVADRAGPRCQLHVNTERHADPERRTICVRKCLGSTDTQVLSTSCLHAHVPEKGVADEGC